MSQPLYFSYSFSDCSSGSSLFSRPRQGGISPNAPSLDLFFVQLCSLVTSANVAALLQVTLKLLHTARLHLLCLLHIPHVPPKLTIPNGSSALLPASPHRFLQLTHSCSLLFQSWTYSLPIPVPLSTFHQPDAKSYDVNPTAFRCFISLHPLPLPY